MDSVPPVNPIPADPMAWPVRSSHERLAAVVRDGHADQAHHDCEARQCRVLLAAQRREINQLRQALAQAPQGDEPAAAAAPDPKASPPTERKAYGPDPIGKAPEIRESLPPDQAPPVSVMQNLRFTNIGSLLDVLA